MVYKEVAEANADLMLKRAAQLGCELRPHMKTHKTLEAGAMATGGSKRRIAVSTLAEAEFYADGAPPHTPAPRVSTCGEPGRRRRVRRHPVRGAHHRR